jgi:hypothetical protein
MTPPTIRDALRKGGVDLRMGGKVNKNLAEGDHFTWPRG